MAEICLKMNKPEQAIIIAQDVLSSTTSRLQRQEAQRLLAAAYLAKQEYENAALTFSGMLTEQEGAKQQ